MAFIRFKDGHTLTVSAEKGNAIWLVKNGELESSEKQQRYVETIASIYLNYDSAPDSYKESHPKNDAWKRGERSKSVLGGYLPYKD